MKKTFENSSNISEIEYFEEEKTLRVTFIKGAQYDYLNVPKEVAEQAETAPSIGSYVQSNIKGIYQFNKL